MAMVTGLIPILRTAVETTTDYAGRTMWFGFAVVRLIALYVSELPWGKLDLDFDCRGNGSSEFCRKDCFNNHFNVPVVSLWNSAYVYFVASVLLMELFTSQLRQNLTKATVKKKPEIPDGPLIETWTSELAHKEMVLDFHHQRTLLVLYLVCILLRLLGELVFLYILFYWHLPLVYSNLYECSTEICPGPFTCVVRFTAEKRMSLYLLGMLSIILSLVCLVFGVFSGFHYMHSCRKHRNESI